MKLFLWQRLEQVSSSYHPEGGVVIVASDKGHAKRLIVRHNEEHGEYGGIEISDDDWGKVVVYDLVDKPEPVVYIFPDAGCC